ncbi:zinc transporter ZIP11-like [Gymnodraco acuticeps]|uniref:Zinc transporter ZIP11 n=1 Tax=Gymnodraco acuticeps TaxID=8218 RepID=A0A6P8V1S7_GYMAC|nr:zinc transporter ZIP11-like [Gymnodraco acuticeps]
MGTAEMLQRVFADEKAKEVRDLMDEYLKRLQINLGKPQLQLAETRQIELVLSAQLTRLKNSMLVDGHMNSMLLKQWVNGAAFHTQMLIHQARLEEADGSRAVRAAGVYQQQLNVIIDRYKKYLIEGLAVGVAFGAIGKTSSASFESARNLAIGIGIQNFPEGLAVSLPLRGSGMSTWKSFWYGQLSGMVEPIAGVLGALAVVLAEPLLPYALAFAAGAMVYVVVDDIIPEAQVSGNGKLASWTSIVGFVVMMSLDVGLG